MASKRLLITGATGFVGFKVLLDALEAGYTVRAAVRSRSRSDLILSNPKIKALGPGDQLSFIEVPDILKDDAYDEALKDVTYVIHIASPLPLPSKDPEAEIYQPGVKGAANILASALKASSVKRVVITSSIVSNMPYPPVLGNVINAHSRVPNLDGPYTEPFSAYRAAKIHTLNATDDFGKQNKPSFGVINIIPGYVFGRNEMATDTASLLTGSNRLLLSLLQGATIPVPQLGGVAHVNDVAKVHLLALNEEIQGRQDFGVNIPTVYDDAFDIVKKHFPKAVEDGIFTQGHQPSLGVNWDASQTEEHFGLKFKTYEHMVVDVAGQYLEFNGKRQT